MDKPVKMAKGFKKISSLDANMARYPRARTPSVDGAAVPPEVEPIEDPQTPVVMTKPAEHPLQRSWYASSFLSFPLQIRIKSVDYRLMYLYTGRYITTQSQGYPTRP